MNNLICRILRDEVCINILISRIFTLVDLLTEGFSLSLLNQLEGKFLYLGFWEKKCKCKLLYLGFWEKKCPWKFRSNQKPWLANPSYQSYSSKVRFFYCEMNIKRDRVGYTMSCVFMYILQVILSRYCWEL